MKDVQAALAGQFNDTIGSQTRLYFVEVADAEYLDQGFVFAYSEHLGNVKVFVGEHRWVIKGDRIYITKIAASDKYANYQMIGWVANAYDFLPGSVLTFDSLPVESLELLPIAAHARKNQVRLVGTTPYYFDGTTWVPLGVTSIPRQFVWFLSGTPIVGQNGAVVQLTSAATVLGAKLYAATPPAVAVSIDMQYSTDLTTWTSLFSSRPAISVGGNTGADAVVSVTTLAAGAWIRLSVVSGDASDITAMLRLTA